MGKKVCICVILIDPANMRSGDIKPICPSTNLWEYMLVMLLPAQHVIRWFALCQSDRQKMEYHCYLFF